MRRRVPYTRQELGDRISAVAADGNAAPLLRKVAPMYADRLDEPGMFWPDDLSDREVESVLWEFARTRHRVDGPGRTQPLAFGWYA